MTSVFFYLDESGDLGWIFDKSYREGGSSRFLTISALVVPESLRAHPKRVIKRLYEKRKWNPKKEKKWSDMTDSAREDFARSAGGLAERHSTIQYHAITVRKGNVANHIRTDPNKLYNWMILLMLLDLMSQFDKVTLVPDPRSLKVESGNSLHDYLQTELWMRKEVSTELKTVPNDSSKNRNIQFADMLCGLVQSHFEDSKSNPKNILGAHIRTRRLFF